MLIERLACSPMLLALLGAGCASKSAPPSPEPAASAKPAPLRLGAPVSSDAPVALADLARNPRSFEGRALVTTGTVTAVCQGMGCWMEIADADGQAHIRMHGHSFFVPKTASGRRARVSATVVPAEDAKECDESPSPGGPTRALAKVELDATGIELD